MSKAAERVAFRKVVSAELLTSGQRERGALLYGQVWRLTLECGHTTYRQDRRHSAIPANIRPVPRRVRCLACFGEQARKKRDTNTISHLSFQTERR